MYIYIYICMDQQKNTSDSERLGEDFFNQLRARVPGAATSSSSSSSSLRPLIVAMGTRGDAASLKVGTWDLPLKVDKKYNEL